MTFLALLALIFITLKLTGVLVWSWWLVLLPIYGPLAFFVGGGLMMGATVVALAGLWSLWDDGR